MTELEWLGCDAPDSMLWFLKDKGSDRKLRLFACACCRRIWDLLGDQRSRLAVETAEVHADSPLPRKRWWAVRSGALSAATSFDRPEHARAADAAQAAFDVTRENASLAATHTMMSVWGAFDAVYQNNAAGREERSQQSHLIRDIFGNPFSAVWGATSSWDCTSGRTIAQQIYDGRAFDRLPDLGDALEEAGFSNPEISAHLRNPGPHVRGCWVIDLILGRT